MHIIESPVCLAENRTYLSTHGEGRFHGIYAEEEASLALGALTCRQLGRAYRSRTRSARLARGGRYGVDERGAVYVEGGSGV